ncbi:RWD domain-containing protein 2A [Anopheles ziemanni]|uniref:RWD domain-containing protein 2A n=1 Tax=Anopheles coustani TaxID=139045 RepID=UPI00265B4927|nr:RWD domain-containing protein 2A [Anopheles coustani]XP_058174006.1 RWD domain-containing protein 2A [Anopheles ziemanni]
MEANNEEEELQQSLLLKNLQKQLEEFQMLSAIFCTPGELEVDDYGCIENLTSFTNGEKVNLSTKLDYRLNLPLLAGEKVQILVELPHLYPSLEIPRIVIRSAIIQRDQERMLTERIERYISEEVIERDEPYVYQVICWIQESLEELLRSTTEKRDNEPNGSSRSKSSIEKEAIVFERLWIYSHHLKSKTKRQKIIKTARDLDLTGFSRPGKPAIICVEGNQHDTQEFWRIIKALKWQKIQIKLNETSGADTTNDFSALRHFSAGFHEELFCETDDDEDLPMSMSLFMKFLEKNNCSYIKKIIFGFQDSNDLAAS